MNILQEDTLSLLQSDLIEKAKIMSKAYEYYQQSFTHFQPQYKSRQVAFSRIIC